MNNCFRCGVSLVLSFLLVIPPAVGYSATKEAGVPFPMKYEGGSLKFDQHGSLKVFVSKDQLVVVQGETRHLIPVAAITEISYGNDVHRRVGAAVGVGVVTLGVGALLALVKTKKHFVGVVWADPSNTTGDTGKGGVVFKVGKGDYRGFIAALEGVSGKKAVNADSGPGGGGTSKP